MEHSSFVAIHECGFYIWHCLHWDDSMDLNTTGIESIIKKKCVSKPEAETCNENLVSQMYFRDHLP